MLFFKKKISNQHELNRAVKDGVLKNAVILDDVKVDISDVLTLEKVTLGQQCVLSNAVNLVTVNNVKVNTTAAITDFAQYDPSEHKIKVSVEGHLSINGVKCGKTLANKVIPRNVGVVYDDNVIHAGSIKVVGYLTIKTTRSISLQDISGIVIVKPSTS